MFGIRDKYNLNFELIENGDLIKEKVDSHDYWQIKEGEKILAEAEGKFQRSEHKKWVVAFFLGILGGVAAFYIAKLIYSLLHTAYDRAYLDTTIDELLGDYKYTDLITEQPLFIGYSFNV